MKIGYARVSTGDQNLDMQMDALNKIECDKIFTDKMSGEVRTLLIEMGYVKIPILS